MKKKQSVIIRELEQENKLLKEQLHVFGLKQHGSHSGLGYSSTKFVEGAQEKLVESWKTCKMTFCKSVYDLVHGKDNP